MQLRTDDLLFALSRGLDCVERDFLGVTTNHCKRVAFLSMLMGQRLGLEQKDVFDLGSCAVLHDNALTEYALKVGTHQAARLENLQFHCQSGEVNSRLFPFLGNTAGVILNHHENWDGSGFFGKKKEETCIRAAILRLADNLDLHLAMGRGLASIEEDAIAHVQEHREKIYNPAVVDAFFEIFNDQTVQQMSDNRIDFALKQAVPPVDCIVGVEELLHICAMFSSIIDAKSPFTKMHCQGIARKAGIMAQYYNLEPEHAQKLVAAAHLHDVGKLATPLRILEKPGSLDKDEFDIMRNHVRVTADILEQVHGMEDVASWAANHHERLNGLGYHRGLSGDEIPMESRLLACIDVYQALVEDRPYRKAMTPHRALDILTSMGDGKNLDGDIVADLCKVAKAAHT